MNGPFAKQCKFLHAFPSYLFEKKKHSVLSSSLQIGINISDVTSKSFAGISHFSVRAAFPS